MKLPRLDLTSLVLILFLGGGIIWVVSDIRRGISDRRTQKLQSEIKSGLDAYSGTNQTLSTEDQSLLKSIAEQAK